MLRKLVAVMGNRSSDESNLWWLWTKWAPLGWKHSKASGKPGRELPGPQCTHLVTSVFTNTNTNTNTNKIQIQATTNSKAPVYKPGPSSYLCGNWNLYVVHKKNTFYSQRKQSWNNSIWGSEWWWWQSLPDGVNTQYINVIYIVKVVLIRVAQGIPIFHIHQIQIDTFNFWI